MNQRLKSYCKKEFLVQFSVILCFSTIFDGLETSLNYYWLTWNFPCITWDLPWFPRTMRGWDIFFRTNSVLLAVLAFWPRPPPSQTRMCWHNTWTLLLACSKKFKFWISFCNFVHGCLYMSIATKKKFRIFGASCALSSPARLKEHHWMSKSGMVLSVRCAILRPTTIRPLTHRT